MRDIYTRKIERPVVSTWMLWLGIGILLFATSLEAGAKWETTLLPIVMGVINPAIIVALSVRRGKYVWTRLDIACVVACLATIAIWQTTESALLGIVGGVIVDAIAAIPQVRKNWKDPGDEPVFPWTMFALGSAMNILAVEEWVLKYWFFPVYMTLMSSLLLALPLILYRIKLRRLKQSNNY